MREIDRLKSMVSTICETRLYPAASEVEEASTDCAALIYLVWLEGKKPDVFSDFWAEVALKRGKTAVQKTGNFVIDETPLHIRRLVQEMKNQITSTVEMLLKDWAPVKTPTFDDVLAEIGRMGGLNDLHRRWMNYLGSRNKHKREETEELLDLGRLTKRQKEAESRGMTVEQLAEQEEQERMERYRKDEQHRFDQYVNSGTVVGNFDWLTSRAIYVEDNGRLVKLSDDDRDRTRTCMTKH
jgi:peroxiredoxin family protein